MKYPHLVALSLAATLVFFGCRQGKRPDGFPPIYPFSVKVVQAGEPLAEASVIFHTDDASIEKWAVGGSTDERGVAKISTQGFPGAPIGTFKVTVQKIALEGGPTNAEEARAMSPDQYAKMFELVAPEFKNVDETPFVAEVGKKQREILTLDLGETYREEISAGH